MSDRPQFTITCDGIATRPHKPAIVAVYARDDDGTWLPIHSAIRDGKTVVLPESGYRTTAGQFNWPCPNRRCSYQFRAAVERVNAALDRLLADGQADTTLRHLDGELRHAQ